jgi:hypothetical protein
MKKSIALVLSLIATSLAVACGGSDDKSTSGTNSTGEAGDSSGGSGNSSGGAANCSAPGGTSDACFNCVKSSCGSQYSDFCADNCGSNPSSLACSSASLAVGSCAAQNCNDVCNDSSGEAGSNSGNEGGSPGNETGGSSNGGAGAVTNAECKKLEPCCADLTSGPQAACTHIAGLNSGPSCMSTYSLYNCDSVIAAGNKPKTAACTSGMQCFMGPYASDEQASACTQSGGVASDTCPATDVVGCCSLAGGMEEMCTYKGYSDPITESDCTAENGTFSTTP